jgi:hypothetical protein
MWLRAALQTARASAWARVFAAYASAQTQVLLKPTPAGTAMREALLQASRPALRRLPCAGVPVLSLAAVG